MPPTKLPSLGFQSTRNQIIPLAARRPISLRSGNNVIIKKDSNTVDNIGVPNGKRKSDATLKNDKVKRSALGNLTNAVLNFIDDGKKDGKTKKQTALIAPEVTQKQTKVMTRASTRLCQPAQKPLKPTKTENKAENINTMKPRNYVATTKSTNQQIPVVKPQSRRISNDFDRTEDDSVYMSALEDFSSSSIRLSMNSLDAPTITSCKSGISSLSGSNESLFTLSQCSTMSSALSSQSDVTLSQELANVALSNGSQLPEGVSNYDRDNWDEPNSVSNYAWDIFSYLKERESQFIIEPYMHRQTQMTAWIRTLLVDWMVEVQETFELNHETLYLAVKIVDIYLGKVDMPKNNLQLLGAAAMFIACKFDERTPPAIEDIMYICDGAYKQQELIKMEMEVFRSIGYDLGIPLSYRFLRRYSRTSNILFPTLTLARFILEFSLMNYNVISFSDSKMAAACMFMALRMKNQEGWNKTLEYYSGYKLSDFASIVPILNASLHQKQKDANKTIRTKYSHKLFEEVSLIPLKTNEELFENCGVTFHDKNDENAQP